MASLKLILFKGKTHADGTHPIMLQHTVNGKVKRKGVYRCHMTEWDPKTSRVKHKVRNSSYINNLLSEKYVEAERRMIKIASGQDESGSVFEDNETQTIDEALEKELLRLKDAMKTGAYSRMLGLKLELKDYARTSGLLLIQMNMQWFTAYINHLQTKGNIGATIQKKIKMLRSIVVRYLGKAKVSDELLMLRVKSVKSVKQKLTEIEFNRIESLNLPEADLLTATRDLFVLQVYLRGIRVGDLLQARCVDFIGGNFTYKADKTGAGFKIRLIPKAQSIVDKYSGSQEILFPFFAWKDKPKTSDFDNKRARLKQKESATTIVNKHLRKIAELAGIDKPLSSHIARHTFARMAIDKINNPMVTMELLGHSSLAVHQQYLNDIRKDDVLDQAADDIFG